MLALNRNTITCYKSWKGPVDPAADEDHGKHVGHVTFHHVCKHAGVCNNTGELVYSNTNKKF